MSFPQVGVDPLPGQFERIAVDIGDNGLLLEVAAKAQIVKHLETECKRQEDFWSNRLAGLANLAPGQHLPKIRRVILPENVFIGPRPSLLGSTIDMWPNITVRCGDVRPRAEQLDDVDVFDCDFYVEVMTYAGVVEKDDLRTRVGVDLEGQVNMQTHLLSGAVQMCMRSDTSLGGVILPIERPPIIRPSFPSAVAGVDRERVGDYYLYQGRQHIYRITRYSY